MTLVTKDKRKVSGFTFKIKWYFDDDGDISWMGDFQDSSSYEGQEWIIDRQRDVLLGEWQTGICIHCGDDDCNTQVNKQWVCSDCHWTLDQYTSNDELVEVGRQEYDTIVTSDYRHSSYQYWVPSSNHRPPNESDVRPYRKWEQEWCDRLKVGSITEANIQCILEDHKIVEDLNKGHIWFEWYECTMYAGDIEIDSDTLSGILNPDDGDRATYFKEAIDGLLNGNQEEVQARINEREEEIQQLKKYI